MEYFLKWFNQIMLKGKKIISPGPSFQMGWRYVTYREGKRAVSFPIEPMFEGPDVVYIPSAIRWIHVAPTWLKDKRYNVIEYLKSIKWNRELIWQESDKIGCREIQNDDENIIPGSLESTPGGKFLEGARFFHPDQQQFNFKQARQIWVESAKKCTQNAKGRVTIIYNSIIPNSVFEKVEFPELKNNPNVTLDIKNYME